MEEPWKEPERFLGLRQSLNSPGPRRWRPAESLFPAKETQGTEWGRRKEHGDSIALMGSGNRSICPDEMGDFSFGWMKRYDMVYIFE